MVELILNKYLIFAFEVDGTLHVYYILCTTYIMGFNCQTVNSQLYLYCSLSNKPTIENCQTPVPDRSSVVSGINLKIQQTPHPPPP